MYHHFTVVSHELKGIQWNKESYLTGQKNKAYGHLRKRNFQFQEQKFSKSLRSIKVDLAVAQKALIL